MPQALNNREYNTFVKGIITEANPLTFPENATIDEVNFVLNQNGSRQRRLGLDREVGGTSISTSPIASSALKGLSIDFIRWDNVNNDATIGIGGVRIGTQIWFFDLNKEPLTDTMLNSGASFVVSEIGTDPISWTNSNGQLIIATKNSPPVRIEYDSTTDTFTKTSGPILIRDLFGLEDNLKVDERVLITDLDVVETLRSNKEHEYNLANQGWRIGDISNALDVQDLAGVSTDEVSPAPFIPSNADITSSARNSSDKFDANLLRQSYFGTSEAPKGRFIIDAFNRGASRATEISTYGYWNRDVDIPTYALDKHNSYPTAVASYAGRLFYAGVLGGVEDGDARSPNYGGFIFYSQLVKGSEDFKKCYQQADPTSEDISDVVATDGGFLQITEASNIQALVPLGNSLVIFAENGVWELYGGDVGFTATDQQVNKVTAAGLIGKDSVVVADSVCFYFSQRGIYALAHNELGRLTATNISESTIKTLYLSIDESARSRAKGHFVDAKVRWLYDNSAGFDPTEEFSSFYNELIFDTTLQAFYTNAFPTGQENYLASYVSVPGFTTVSSAESTVVLTTGEEITTTSGELVIVTGVARANSSASSEKLKYLGITGKDTSPEFSFVELNNTSFADWYWLDSSGTDAAAFMITGYDISGDTQREKQVATHLQFHFNRTETFIDTGSKIEVGNESSCLVRYRWDFADQGSSNKWMPITGPIETYRYKQMFAPTTTFDPGFEVISTKNKVRGRGKALSMKIETAPLKDLQLLGWGTVFTINRRG